MTPRCPFYYIPTLRVGLVGVLKGKVPKHGHKLSVRDVSPGRGGCVLRGVVVGKRTSMTLLTFL